MNWNNLTKWEKNYIALSFAIWALTIAVSMVFYMGTGSGSDLPPAPFVWGFMVLLIAIFVYVPVNLIFSLREFKEKNGKLTSSYISKKVFRLVIDLLVVYYFFHLFFTYKDVYFGFL